MKMLRSVVSTCSMVGLALSVMAYAQGSRTPPANRPPTPPTEGRQPPPPPPPPKAGDTVKKASMGDASFLKDAAQDGMAEVQLAKLAEQKAADARIKNFAEQLQKDHEQAQTELMALAQQKNVKLPTEISTIRKMSRNSLSKKEGAEFDKAWINQMVKDHTDAVKDFEDAAKSKDAQVKAFAEKTLPKLREHLAKSQELKKSMAGAQ